MSGVKWEVRRLANAPEKEPYKIEIIEGVSEKVAHLQSTEWWESGGTLAIVVKCGEAEDARYEREYIDEERIPNGWVQRPKVKRPSWKDVMVEVDRQEEAPAKEAVAPTIFNEDEPQDPENVPDPGQIRQLLSKVGQGEVHLCWTCKHVLQDHEETDKTPSGRLNEYRCPECGHQLQGMTHTAINMMYLRAQSAKAMYDHKAKTIDKKKPKKR